MSEIKDTQVIVDVLRKIVTRHKQCEGADWALTEKELVPYQKLLNELEPQDILQKSAWLFEDYYVQLPHKRYHDTNKGLQEQDEVRFEALKEVVEEKGVDGLWDFVQIVKCPESLSKSIVSFFDDKLNNNVCQKYRNKELGESFTKSYLSALCHKDLSKYATWAEQTVASDEEMIIVLYAPGYVKELADIAEKHGDMIKCHYWESVNVGFFTKDNIEEVVRELIKVRRYSEALEIIGSNRDTIQIADIEIVHLLYNCLTKGANPKGHLDMYYITSVLEELDKSEDPNVIRLLIIIEFLLYQHIEHQMDISKLRFTKELSKNPELMIQLVELAFRSDDGDIEQLEGINNENRKLMAENAFHILHFSYHIISFNNENGVFDGDYMKQYIEQLYRLAREKKRLQVIDLVIGYILGDIPRDDNYPPQALCEIVEELNNDIIDQHIRMRIYNSRGFSSRAYNEGGDQERSIVSRFEKYKEKTKLLYPRITEIFNQLIQEYKSEAGKIDDEAIIADLDY